MQQVKMFKGVDNELDELERQINRWMRKSGAKIVSVTGNLSASPSAGAGPMSTFAAGDVLVILFYEYDPPKKD
ncbi:MAG: hypothetical protein AB8B91_14435 [Rubripirellula sp.]